jgi:hypothetical protein
MSPSRQVLKLDIHTGFRSGLCDRRNITWKWLGTQQQAKRLLATVLHQQSDELTQQELVCLHSDLTYTRKEVQIKLLRVDPTVFTPSAASMPQTPTAPFYLAGFLSVHNHTKWGELLFQWLPTFEPTAFLIGRINSEAPMGPAATAWTTCVRAMTNLLRQTEQQVDFGQYLPNDTHNQLQMLTRCIQILLVRVQVHERQHMRPKPKLSSNIARGCSTVARPRKLARFSGDCQTRTARRSG